MDSEKMVKWLKMAKKFRVTCIYPVIFGIKVDIHRVKSYQKRRFWVVGFMV